MDDPDSIAAPGASPYGPFLTTANGAPGLTRRQVDGDRFVAPSRGVRYAADAPDPRASRRSAAQLATRPDSVLAGLSAAEHWGLPVPAWVGLDDAAKVVLAVPPGSAHPDRRGVRGRRLLLPPEHVTLRRGQRVTTAARTWLDCAADLPIEHVIAMGDAALRMGLVTMDDLAAVTRWAYRRRGVLNARRALPLLDARSESPGESVARAHLVLNRVPRPICNMDISSGGVWIARVDMCWPEQRVIVEYDGAVHLAEDQRRRDARRRNQLQEAGWLVITFTADDVRRPWLMATQVLQALRSRAAR
jgi:hypothetical protein